METKDIVKHYTTDNIKIKWEPSKCTHSTNCWKPPLGLPKVFNPKERPWIRPENEHHELIREHIHKCPSGALSYEGQPAAIQATEIAQEILPKIEFIENGPIVVSGKFECKTKMDGADSVFLCRCGGSSNKPFCDGSHAANGFVAP